MSILCNASVANKNNSLVVSVACLPGFQLKCRWPGSAGAEAIRILASTSAEQEQQTRARGSSVGPSLVGGQLAGSPPSPRLVTCDT